MNKFKESSGFTLIEIIVVIAIIGIGIVPMLNYFTNSIYHIQETEIRSQAVTIAGDVIEFIKQESSTNWGYLNTNFNNNNDSSDNGSKEEELLDNIKNDSDFLVNDFVLDIRISDFGSSEKMQKVIVEISWDSANKSEEVITVIRNKEGDSSGS
ncbi:prepilin-type N-terminal cleavage/methylation domain-containing protein [Halanaerobium congolense]|jgi:prepilin-type N-terminal cleavage/methylation domain-containing protein|uniref:Prepilin-type N-terminal cleavage/methylation domain-containing protein n=1 Tax=Halanaerobium congolense TaxID=54121 RepID=A0A4R7EGU0_9FIRM|nr:prepilin-type N-terminal cleavage/methylation domain-containing protein [Halanaerobium congolense]TDS31731.1 prepilin-type N-terminal cleavage/methylation domain-containing protein [Halanaerobium congolense]